MSISTETKTEPDTAQADITERVILRPQITPPATAPQRETRPDKTEPSGSARGRFGRRIRWGLGLLFIAAACLSVGWLALAVHRAHQQRDVVAAILALGGKSAGVRYDYQRTDSGWDGDAPPPGPAWLRNLAGVDSVAHVVEVHNAGSDDAVALLSVFPRLEEFRSDDGWPVKDSVLQHLSAMKGLRRLAIINNSYFGNAQLALLAGMTDLESLDLSFTQITNAGLPSLAGMRNLKVLNLHSCRGIDYLGLAYFPALEKLEVLDISDISESSGCMYGLRGCRSLRKVNLSQTSSNDRDLRSLTELPNLEDIDIGSAELTDAGVECLESAPQLRRLILGRGYTDEGLRHIEPLTELRELGVGARGVTDKGLEHLKGCAKLRALYLYDSQITDMGLARLASFFPGLEKLSVGFCPTITDEGLKSVQKFGNLRELYIFQTKITSAGMQHLKGLDKLEVLVASHIAAGDLAWLDEFPRLRELDLSGSLVNGMEHIAGLKNLRKLSLSGARTEEDAQAKFFGQPPQLRILDLSYCNVSEPALSCLKPLANLQELNLCHSRVTSAGVKQLQGMTSLRTLDLSWNPVDDAAGEALASMNNLENLKLSVTDVGDDLAPYLEKLPRLQGVSLDNAGLSTEAVEELRQKMPWCGVSAWQSGPPRRRGDPPAKVDWAGMDY